MNQQRVLFSWLLGTVLLLFVLFSAGAVVAANQPAVSSPTKTESSKSINDILATMSDEQVRQMLIDELRKEGNSVTSVNNNENTVGGPAALLAGLLNSLDSGSVDFEDRFRNLLPWIPNIIGDLHDNVFKKLSPTGNVQGTVINLLWILFYISFGLLLEQVVKRRVLSLHFQIDSENHSPANGLFPGIYYFRADVVGGYRPTWSRQENRSVDDAFFLPHFFLLLPPSRYFL